MNAWFGPCRTESPLHHDPYHNLLAQVVGSFLRLSRILNRPRIVLIGYKYVRLYHPSESSKLYPREGRMSNNRSSSQMIHYSSLNKVTEVLVAISYVDLCNVDQFKYPLVKEAAYSECILGPGDMLFIPRWYWHFVKAVDVETATEWQRLRGFK